MSVLQIGEQIVISESYNQPTLSADDDPYSTVSKFPSHPHQGIDEGGPFGEVLLKARGR